MELRDLYPLILSLVLVGMLLGIGLIVFDKLADAHVIKANANVSITSVVNQSTGDNAIGSYGNLTTYTVYNNTGTTVTAAQGNWSIWEDTQDLKYYFNTTDNNTVTADEIWILINYDEKTTETRSTMYSSGTELGNIASDWIGLIITVAILAIILVLVISSFGTRR